MAKNICKNGHRCEDTNTCTVCLEFPKISAPAFRALNSIGVTELKQLSSYTEQELLSLHGFGPKALRLLREALATKNLSFSKHR